MASLGEKPLVSGQRLHGEDKDTIAMLSAGTVARLLGRGITLFRI